MIEAKVVGADDVPGIAEDMRLVADELDAVLAAGQASKLLWVLTVDGRPFVLCGFVPLDLLNLSAYAWMQWTPEIYDHPKASTKLCVAIFAEARRTFQLIYGHCSYGARPVALLKRIGARFWTGPDGRPTYVIGETRQ